MSNTLLKKWREAPSSDLILKKDLAQKDQYLKDAFSEKMSFGTAGIRGIMGAGTNKMNEFTVAAASEAYAKFLINHVSDAKKKGIIIGHDNRHNSKLFSEVTARVLMANGINAFLYDNNDLQPTPLVSYTIRKLKLAGGVIITASHNPKEYNGFKVYNNLGAQLMPCNTKKIQKIMKTLDPLEINKSNRKIKYLDNNIIESYTKESIQSIRIIPELQSDIKVAFSPLHGTSAKIIPDVLDRMGIENYIVEKQRSPNADFKYAKSANPEESKSYDKVISLARKKRAELAVVTDPDADRIGIVVKHKKRYKYLNGNQTAAIYLNYKLTELKKNNKIPKDGYIVKSNVSGVLAAKVAKSFGLKVYETHVGFKNIANIIEKTNGTFLMGYEESYGMVLDSSLVRDKDSIQSVIGITEMVAYLKSQNIDAYSYLKELYLKFGVHRTTQISKKLDISMTTRLLNRMSKIKKLNGKKIDYIEDYRNKKINGLEKNNLVKVFLKNGSWFAIRPSGTEPKVKLYVQSIGTTKQKLMDVVILEKEVINFIEDNTEVFESKHWSWKVFFKYLIFISIIIIIMSFVFTKVYSQGLDGNVFHDAHKILDKQSRGIWMSIMLFTIFYTFINGLIRKRLIDFHGQKVKIRHIMISGFMGSIISYITPFAIGGDAIGYWYLRRKGFKRGPLLSSFITSTIIYQIVIVLQTSILFPIGLPLYKEIMFSDNPQALGAFVLFIIGVIWNIFATIMIFSLTISKKFQEFIIRNAIKLLEWLPFIKIQDPGMKSSSYMYEFREMRNGMQKIWKKKFLLLEIIFYELVYMFVNSGSIILLSSGVLLPNLERGDYLTQLIVADMSTTANSLSITPGGSGTGEWLNIVINQHIYKAGSQLGIGGDSSNTASALDLIWKLISSWPQLILSSLLIFTIIIGESRTNKYKIEKKNKKLRGLNYFGQTSYYKIISIPWIIIITGYILFIIYI